MSFPTLCIGEAIGNPENVPHFLDCLWIPGQAFGLPGMTAPSEWIGRISYEEDMANVKRGEIDATLDNKNYTLCLTLGALAELESGFGASDLIALASRFEERRLSARDILRIIGCGLRGAGHDISDEEVARMKVSEGLAGYVRIAADLLAATFGDTPEQSANANPPTPQDA
jgi:hypothetical protein